MNQRFEGFEYSPINQDYHHYYLADNQEVFSIADNIGAYKS